MATIHLEIVTPQKVVYKDEVDEVLVPTPKGQIGILPHHIPLVTEVISGELVIKKGNKEDFLAVAGGFLEVSPSKVTILADYAIHSDDIQVIKVEEAKQRAERLMKEKMSDEDLAQAQAELQRSLLELRVSRRRRSHSNLPNQS